MTEPRGEDRYSLYLDADLNRVFTGSLLEVAATELRLVANGQNQVSIGDIERVADGRAQLLRFSAEGSGERLAAVIGQLSASAALFQHRTGTVESDPGVQLLEPIPIAEPLVYGSELATTQRYKGKTNERLTRAMLNVALATAGVDITDPSATVLDPMCGRGTTLNWALAYGLDGIGIEIDAGSLEQHAGFLQTWAKRQRLPHKVQRFRAGNAEHRNLTLEVGPDRRTFKDGGGQRLQTFCADGADRKLAIKRGSVDVIVTDLPYGVQHRGAPDDNAGRRPADDNAGRGSETTELLERMLPAWRHWLRAGGAICLAWNTKRAGRREIGRVLAEAGFSPVTAAGGYSMRHTVDATIDRDVIVARR